MSNAGHVRASESVARRRSATKPRRGRSRKERAQKSSGKNHVHKNHVPENALPKPRVDEREDERVIRAKGLLAATLRVWELKRRIGD
jgi:hypothetical protein